MKTGASVKSVSASPESRLKKKLGLSMNVFKLKKVCLWL